LAATEVPTDQREEDVLGEAFRPGVRDRDVLQTARTIERADLQVAQAGTGRLHFLIHGVHHDHPNDPLRLVMPILLSGPIMAIAFLVTTLLFGATLRYPVLTGFIIGYLAYDMVHFYTHHAQPTTKLGLTLRRLHLMHHFRDHEGLWGERTLLGLRFRYGRQAEAAAIERSRLSRVAAASGSARGGLASFAFGGPEPLPMLSKR
jgi:hypothetical protein